MVFRRKTIASVPSYISFDGIEIEVIQKKIKHMYLHVKAPKGEVQIRVPHTMKERDILSFIDSKKEWLHKKRQQIISLPQPIDYKYVDDEEHYYNGIAHRLQLLITKKKQGVERIANNVLLLKLKEKNSLASRERVLNQWYKEQLYQQVKHYVAIWEPIMGVKVEHIGIKKMKTKWGTCNITNKKIWLNLKLAKKSPQCVEYVVVHEMVHLLERYHNKRFKSLMTQYIPEWKILHEQLHYRLD